MLFILQIITNTFQIDRADDKDDSMTTICSLPSFAGPCQGRLTRYYFDTALLTCVPFRYGGCKGNKNNFPTEDECMDTCFMGMMEEMKRRRQQQDKQLELEGKQLADKKGKPQNEAEKDTNTDDKVKTPSKKNKKGKKHKKHKGTEYNCCCIQKNIFCS